MIEALYEGAPGWIGPAAAAPFAAEDPPLNGIWSPLRLASRACRPSQIPGALGQRRRRARTRRRVQRELHAEGRFPFLRLLELAFDLLHELRDDREPERAAPLRRARLQSDAVVADREDAAITLALCRKRDRAAAP